MAGAREWQHRLLGTLGVLGVLLAASCSSEADAPEAAADPTTTAPDAPIETSDAADEPTETIDAAAETAAADQPADTTTTVAPAPLRCDPSSPPDGPVTIRVWHGLSGNVQDLVPEVLGRFEREHPGVTVELIEVNSGYPAAIDELARTAADDLPDVIMGSNQTVRLQADSGRFIPVGECTGGQTPDQLTDLLPAVERTYTVDGTLWAAPFNASAPVMLYDRNRWRRAGLDPDSPPATYPELVETIRALAASGEAATGAVFYDRSAMWLLEQAAAKEDRALVEPDNGRAGVDITGTSFATDETVDLLRTLGELKRDGIVHWAGLNETNQEDLAKLIDLNEPTGLTLNSSAVIGDIIRYYEGGVLGDVEIGVAPMPGPGRGSTVGGGAWWLVDRGDPARAGVAWTLVEWLTQPDIVAEIAAFTGYIPTTERAAASPITQERWAEWPVLRVAYDQVLAAPDTPAGAGLQVGPMTQVLRALEVAAAFAIDVGDDPVALLAEADEQAREVLDLYASGLAATGT